MDTLLTKTWMMVDRTGDHYRIKRTVQATDSAYVENESGLVVGHCKSIIESLCKSILDERGVEYKADEKVGKLAKQALSVFNIGSGLDNEKKAREAFKSLVTSF